MGLVLIVIAVMVALNGVFAAYELALASVRPERLRALREQQRAGASAAVFMKERIEASLAVVQLGITLVGAIAAATGGASAEEKISPWMVETFRVSESMADFLAIALLVVPLSAVTIIVGELIPKVFAIRNAELVCLALSPLMRVFALITFPVVWIFEQATKVVVKLATSFVPQEHAGSSDRHTGLHELRAQVNLLRASKAIGVAQEKIMLQASRLSELRVSDIMLPAEDIVMVLADGTIAENLVIAHMDLHTRFPVTTRKGDPQGIVGYVNFKELVLLAKTHPNNPMLDEITRPLISLTASITVSEALRRMLAEHLHLALVRDDQDQVVGMVTQEDVFEELFGDILDEFDRLPKHIAPSGRQWVLGGGATLGRLRDLIKRPDLGGELPGETTVSEWLHHAAGHRLKGGDVLQIDGISLTVRKVRRRQVTEALLDVTPVVSPAGTFAAAHANGNGHSTDA
jgi:putative hemolysin